MISSICDRESFQILRQKGRQVRSGPIMASYFFGGSGQRRQENVQVAFALSKKMGNAAKRNLLRRRLKEAIRSLDKQCQTKPGMYLFRANQEAFSASYQELEASVQGIFSKIPKAEGK